MKFEKMLDKIATSDHHGPHEVFRAFVLMVACCLAMGTREPEYLAEAKRWKPDSLSLFSHAFGQLILDMEARPFADLLGPIHMEIGSKSSKQWSGEFYTPAALSQMMARMTFDPESVPRDRPIDVEEPACGSGGMVLALAEVVHGHGMSVRRLRARCTDVSRTACDMCYVNLALWGIPAKIIHGNTLSGEVWGQWVTPWYWMAHSDLSRYEEDPPVPSVAANGQFLMDLIGGEAA